MKIAVDIDGTVVELLPSERLFEAEAKPEMVAMVNALYDAGHEITVYTARGMTRLKGQAHLIPHEYYEKTKAQLDRIGLRYHTIVFGKIAYDVLIDDKAFNVNDLDEVRKLLK